MATTKRESSLGKEKRGTSPSNPSVAHGQRRSTPGSTDKQVPNYLKPTISSRNDGVKTVKKTGPEDTSQRPNLLRRRSFDRPPSAARVQKALISPAREKPTTSRSASFSSKPTAAPKATLERVAKKPNAGKPQTTTLSSSRSMKKTTSPTTKKASTSSSGSKNPPVSSHDKKEAQEVETKHENKENVDHQPEEVVKDDQGEIDDSELPKAEESEHPDVVDTSEVKSVEEGKENPGGISAASQEHNVPPPTEEMEDKFQEEKSDHTRHEEDKENRIKEETDDLQEKIPHEEAKTETEDKGEENNVSDEVATTKEIIGEENELESRQENDEGRQQGLQSSKEEVIAEEVEEPKPEAANVVAKSHGRKESATPYNDVIEETASKLLEERKNKLATEIGDENLRPSVNIIICSIARHSLKSSNRTSFVGFLILDAAVQTQAIVKAQALSPLPPGGSKFEEAR
ncbi:Uncharacterized protein TCM_036820 [Theobroma cacao]|uniref:Calmodulin-binding domain-containing protein n=1 Tax=Theobroma cacao TaxID=3641 RepID=A0A061GQ41_THECC|nr:Uncharacterized protein TCM_036820 [Theobroma cacao]